MAIAVSHSDIGSLTDVSVSLESLRSVALDDATDAHLYSAYLIEILLIAVR